MADRFLPTLGAVVTCRDRQWVVLPSEIPEVIRLRPLSGNEDQVCGIYQPLKLEPITSAQFPVPKADATVSEAVFKSLFDRKADSQQLSLLDLLDNDDLIAAHCGFTITDAVEQRTTLLLLRSRYLLGSRESGVGSRELLAEECFVAGFTGPPSNPLWLEPEDAQKLLQQAEPVGDIAPAFKRLEIEDLLNSLGDFEEELHAITQVRSQGLVQSHRRVRSVTKEGQVRVKPQLPMDILGVYVLQTGSKRG